MSDNTPSDNTLSASLEDYLEMIYELSGDGRPVRSGDVAERLHVKRPSATVAIQLLQKKGLIEYDPYQPITLTEKGRVEAARVLRRHQAVALFLEQILGVEKQKSQRVACEIEHAIDSEIATRLIEFIQFLEVCPRGGMDWLRNASYHCRQRHDDGGCVRCLQDAANNLSRNRSSEGLQALHHDSRFLDKLPEGMPAIVVALPTDVPDVLFPFAPGEKILVLERASGRKKMVVAYRDSKTTLARGDAARVEVLPCDPPEQEEGTSTRFGF